MSSSWADAGGAKIGTLRKITQAPATRIFDLLAECGAGWRRELWTVFVCGITAPSFALWRGAVRGQPADIQRRAIK
jgi:hypothetical protein